MFSSRKNTPEFTDPEELIPTKVNHVLLIFNGFMVLVGLFGIAKSLSQEIPGGLMPLSIVVTIWFGVLFLRVREENFNRRMAAEFLANRP